jgi:predicted Zn finger-like uncharacterized protein
MSLVTRCPACATTFRVLPAQLAARGGRVRCGQCSVVFDGVSNMLDDDDIAALPVAPSPQTSLLESRTETEAAGTEATLNADENLPVEKQAESAAPPAEEPAPYPADAETGTPVEDSPAPPVIDAAEPAPELLPVSSPEPAPAFLAPVQTQPARRAAWAVFATLAACGLALQAALAFRSEVAVLLPAARPQIEAACGLLGCDVRLPRRADLMSIESSDLQADTQRQGVIVLNALLRNRAPFAQEYPDLELTLTDQGDQPLVRRVLRPDDYLQDKRAAIGPGLGGGAEESVRVRIEAGGLLATGYQLFLFYPCPPPPTSAFWQLGYPARCQTQIPRNK